MERRRTGRRSKRHYLHLKETIRYVIHTKEDGLEYKTRQNNTKAQIDFYVDSDWATEAADRKSQTGMVVILNGNPVAWFSRKQDMVATSSAGAEYVAFNSPLSPALFVMRLVEEIGVYEAVRMRARKDNLPTIKMIRSLGGTKRRKFIDVRHHEIIDKLDRYGVEVQHVESAKQKADMFTKSLGRVAFKEQRARLRIRCVSQ